MTTDPSTLAARTLRNIQTLDPKARQRFVDFACQAQAKAREFGCDYIMISGNRTWAEQDELYRHGRTLPGPRVTNAKGGYSNHNFGIAGDFGVFRDKKYLDESEPKTADKVHKACGALAEAHGLDWGGEWDSFPDFPHYEIRTGLTGAEKRKRYATRGSVL